MSHHRHVYAWSKLSEGLVVDPGGFARPPNGFVYCPVCECVPTEFMARDPDPNSTSAASPPR